jgi:muramoyltetrapeptide carboxypeptidase
MLTRSGYLAGDDARRSAELAHAMLDPAVEAIVCARGGYGAMRILDGLPWDAFTARPKWIAGFSDITALHLEAAAHGVCTLHAMNVTGLGRTITAAERLSFLDALEGRRPSSWTGLQVVHVGGSKPPSARGPLVGGNLALVVSMAAAGRLVVPEGAIVMLEDVTERPYRVDRMLTSLLLGRQLRRASAVVLGSFTQCEPGGDGVTVSEVLRERTESLGIPVLSGAPFGHGAPNHPFVLGATATLDGTTVRFGA